MQKNKPEADLQDVENHGIRSHTMAMLQLISQGEADIRNGWVDYQDKVFSDLEALLK